MPPPYRHIKTRGLPPGTPVYTGEVSAVSSNIEIFCYNEITYTYHKSTSWNDITSHINPQQISWININSISNTELIEEIGRHFQFHALLLEDIVTVDMLPKLEEYEGYLQFSLKMITLNSQGNVNKEQVSFVLGENYLLSFQENEGDVFNPIRERIIHNKGRVRRKKADYLLMALIDVIVDNYLIVLDELQNKIQLLEEELLGKHIEHAEKHILYLRKQLVSLRKSIFPLRDAMRQLLREEPELIEEVNTKYFRDVLDHIHYTAETLSGFEESINGLMDLYNAIINNRLNNIMKTLTIISSIFIPLSFIAGIYGMNFEYMPELHWKYGYYTVLGVMCMVGIGMMIFMIRKKWL